MDMKTAKKIIRFETQGPADTGLPEIQLDPADFQSELPVQHQHVYYEDEAQGLNVGVWDTTSMQEAFGPYPGDEFMCVLEGQVIMVDGDGEEVLVKDGETFCIRNGIPISWKQLGFLRKFYMTYADPNAPTPDISSAEGGVLVLDPAVLAGGMTKMDSADPFVIKGEAPLQRDHVVFTNDAGNMFAGMWDSSPFESEIRPYPWHEFVQMLEGSMTITEGDGTTHLFEAGDVFFVPMGTVCGSKTTGYVKKLYSILEPAAG